jgi:branched-chain amino acid aminotransferase
VPGDKPANRPTRSLMYTAYFNGQIQPVEQTGIGLTDLGLLRGYALFDYFRTYNGRPFQWPLYWSRIVNSAARMHLPLPLDADQTHAIILDLLARSGQPDIAIRVLLTGGYSPDSISVGSPNLLIIAEAVKTVPPADYEHGIRVILDEYVREMAEVKSTDYKHVIMLAEAMRSAGAQDVLYHRDGEISELSRSNFFLINGRRLITPDRHILYGITRRTVLDLAKPDFEIEERPVSLDEVFEADEAFTTSSIKMVLPVVAVGDRLIGDGRPGPMSRLLLARMQAFCSQ